VADWASIADTLNKGVLGAFGRDVIYLPQTGDQASIQAVFQATRESEESAPGVYGVLFVRLADLPGPPVRGDEVEIDNVRYKVFDIEADTSGAVVLRLRQV
jgi:hypothetical protein